MRLPHMQLQKHIKPGPHSANYQSLRFLSSDKCTLSPGCSGTCLHGLLSEKNIRSEKQKDRFIFIYDFIRGNMEDWDILTTGDCLHNGDTNILERGDNAREIVVNLKGKVGVVQNDINAEGYNNDLVTEEGITTPPDDIIEGSDGVQTVTSPKEYLFNGIFGENPKNGDGKEAGQMASVSSVMTKNKEGPRKARLADKEQDETETTGDQIDYNDIDGPCRCQEEPRPEAGSGDMGMKNGQSSCQTLMGQTTRVQEDEEEDEEDDEEQDEEEAEKEEDAEKEEEEDGEDAEREEEGDEEEEGEDEEKEEEEGENAEKGGKEEEESEEDEEKEEEEEDEREEDDDPATLAATSSSPQASLNNGHIPFPLNVKDAYAVQIGKNNIFNLNRTKECESSVKHATVAVYTNNSDGRQTGESSHMDTNKVIPQEEVSVKISCELGSDPKRDEDVVKRLRNENVRQQFARNMSESCQITCKLITVSIGCILLDMEVLTEEDRLQLIRMARNGTFQKVLLETFLPEIAAEGKVVPMKLAIGIRNPSQEIVTEIQEAAASNSNETAVVKQIPVSVRPSLDITVTDAPELQKTHSGETRTAKKSHFLRRYFYFGIHTELVVAIASLGIAMFLHKALPSWWRDLINNLTPLEMGLATLFFVMVAIIAYLLRINRGIASQSHMVSVYIKDCDGVQVGDNNRMVIEKSIPLGDGTVTVFSELDIGKEIEDAIVKKLSDANVQQQIDQKMAEECKFSCKIRAVRTGCILLDMEVPTEEDRLQLIRMARNGTIQKVLLETFLPEIAAEGKEVPMKLAIGIMNPSQALVEELLRATGKNETFKVIRVPDGEGINADHSLSNAISATEQKHSHSVEAGPDEQSKEPESIIRNFGDIVPGIRATLMPSLFVGYLVEQIVAYLLDYETFEEIQNADSVSNNDDISAPDVVYAIQQKHSNSGESRISTQPQEVENIFENPFATLRAKLRRTGTLITIVIAIAVVLFFHHQRKQTSASTQDHRECHYCSEGTYPDEAGQMTCKPFSFGQLIHGTGAISEDTCQAVREDHPPDDLAFLSVWFILYRLMAIAMVAITIVAVVAVAATRHWKKRQSKVTNFKPFVYRNDIFIEQVQYGFPSKSKVKTILNRPFIDEIYRPKHQNFTPMPLSAWDSYCRDPKGCPMDASFVMLPSTTIPPKERVQNKGTTPRQMPNMIVESDC